MANETLTVEQGSLDVCSMRIHELALQKWLYSKFVVREGFPVPVVFSSPMDAFSDFKTLWKQDKNPFSYLYDLKDDKGTPLYEPYPSMPKYPLISVHRKGWSYRAYQNFSIHKWRFINWPTVSDDAKQCDLGHVTVSQMPMAWDFKFQVDHWSLYPSTQAFFVEKLMRAFWRTGGSPQTWMTCYYPGWGQQYIRMYLEAGIDSGTPEDLGNDKQVEFRTTFGVVVEGFSADVNFQFPPAFWTLVIGKSSASLAELKALDEPIAVVDLRAKADNPIMEVRVDIPEGSACQEELRNYGAQVWTTVWFGTSTGESPNPNTNLDPEYTSPSVPMWPVNPTITFAGVSPINPSFHYGIQSIESWGTHTLVAL